MRYATFIAVVLVIATGCGSKPAPRPYEGSDGLRFLPPDGWSERARAEDVPGAAAGERLLVQYKRLTAGRPAWLRVGAAEASPANLAAAASARAPRGWRAEGKAEALQVGGLPAARQTFVGRWKNQDYLCEVVAVRRGGSVAYVTAAFPAADGEARAQVRGAVAAASWGGGALARR